MRIRSLVVIGLFIVILAGLGSSLMIPRVEAAPVGTIQLVIDCKNRLQKTTITNQTNEELSLTGWTLETAVKPSGNEPFNLARSGRLAPGAAVTYSAGTDAIPGLLTIFESGNIYDDDPLERAIVRTPYGTISADCIGKVGLLRVGPEPTVLITTPTATVASIASATASPTSTVAAVSTPQTFTWLDRPPIGASSTPSCPISGQWFLVYASGPDGTQISNAASACPNSDIFWASRSGKWYGYAKASAAASDTWNVGIGEAHFIRGQ
jgi:hypothetical protein